MTYAGTLLLLLSDENSHCAALVAELSGVYVGAVVRQWLDGKPEFTSARLFELFEVEPAEVLFFEGDWRRMRRSARWQAYDVVEARRGTVYVYKS
jgi:hypothetical protein